MRTWEFQTFLRNLEKITRPPRMGHDVDTPDGAEQLAEAEEQQEVWDGGDCFDCCVGHPEPPLSDDELVAVRGLIQERYEPESVADYMARAERVEGGYIIHDHPLGGRFFGEPAARLDPLGIHHNVIHDGTPVSDSRQALKDAYNRLDDLAAATYSSATPTADPHCLGCPTADDVECLEVYCVFKARPPGSGIFTYSSATPPADDPAGVEHPPVPPAGTPDSDLIVDLAQELADAVGDNYDHGRYGHNFPLWHDDNLFEAFDFDETARTLLRYFDIRKK